MPTAPQADLVAMTVQTFTARRAYELADGYRAQGIPVVMGGYHPSFLPDEALQHADAVLIGDAEGHWERLLADLQAGRLQRIYRSDNQADLADYRIDRSLFAGKRYAPVELVQWGRGCRFVCDFCSIHAFYGKNLRQRELDGLVSELQGLNRRRLLFFVDDNLYSDETSLRAMLRAIAPLGLNWSCQISIDVARNQSLLDAMAEAGCRFVLIGFESLDRANLIQMKKRWNHVAGSYLDVARALHARNIGIYGTFVFGYDNDTPDTIRRAVDFALEARLELANFNPLTPTPGSGLYERLHEEGRLLRPTWWLDAGWRYGDPIFEPARISAQALNEGCFEAKRDFYAWGDIARRTLGKDRPFTWFTAANTLVANLISRREVYRKQGRALGTA
jgi:radical SAM superfamily enzyme YgiQ (UPF0313 family)